MKACWFEADGETYLVGKNYPYYVITGYAHYVKDYREGEETTGCYLFDDRGALMADFEGAVWIESRNEYRYFVNGKLYSTIGFARGDDGYYYYVTGAGVVSVDTEVTVNESQGHGLVPAGTYHVDEKGRFTAPLIGKDNIDVPVSSLIDKETDITVQGKVVTVEVDTAVPVCKVGYKDGEKYVTIEATLNADGTYNFAAPAEATDIKIVILGDADGSGTVDATDIAALKNEILEKTEAGVPDVDEAGMLAGDVNGDGKVTALDLALINAALKKKIDLKW